MKFEFSMDVKGIPSASVKVAFEATNDELITLISDPVYQAIGSKLINEVSFKPIHGQQSQQHDDHHRRNGNRNQHQAREASEKMCGSHQHDEVVAKHLRDLSNRIAEMTKRF